MADINTPGTWNGELKAKIESLTNLDDETKKVLLECIDENYKLKQDKKQLEENLEEEKRRYRRMDKVWVIIKQKKIKIEDACIMWYKGKKITIKLDEKPIAFFVSNDKFTEQELKKLDQEVYNKVFSEKDFENMMRDLNKYFGVDWFDIDNVDFRRCHDIMYIFKLITWLNRWYRLKDNIMVTLDNSWSLHDAKDFWSMQLLLKLPNS